jgi:hypothetical protein
LTEQQIGSFAKKIREHLVMPLLWLLGYAGVFGFRTLKQSLRTADSELEVIVGSGRALSQSLVLRNHGYPALKLRRFGGAEFSNSETDRRLNAISYRKDSARVLDIAPLSPPPGLFFWGALRKLNWDFLPNGSNAFCSTAKSIPLRPGF